MGFGKWNVDIMVGKMPQNVATAFAGLSELLGAKYNAIAYLGSQTVNGTNHAVLAEQTVISRKDAKNIVVVVFNESKDGIALYGIERVVEGGDGLGGLKVDVKTEIPGDAKMAYEEAFEGFTGSNIRPFAYLGMQAAKGSTYVFAAEISPVTLDATRRAVLVAANGLTRAVSFVDLLSDGRNAGGLGYAFTWKAGQINSVRAPGITVAGRAFE